MAGYIGSKASVVSSGAERKKVFNITTSTTALTGLSYTANQVHVFHNGVRLISGTDYTETNDTTITLTNAAEDGDQVVVVSYASFQTSDTVSASAGGTFSGAVDVNADGATVLTVDRATSDGTIVDVQKDGSTVGSIGANGTKMYTGSGATGLHFNRDDASIEPYNPLTISTRDAAIDLGSPDERFKDLYLSGGVYLGGTGSANKLDDYETGTWTATLSDATSGGNTTTTDTDALYTKIGNVVYFQCAFAGNVSVSGMTAGNTFYIQGLPFTSAGNNNSRLGNVDLRTVTYTGGNVPMGTLGDSRTYLYFIETSSNSGFNPLEVSEFSNGDSIFVSGHYFVS